MPIKVPSEQEVWHEAVEILINQLSPAKAMRILSALQLGYGDYVLMREELFGNLTVSEIANETRRYTDKKKKKAI